MTNRWGRPPKGRGWEKRLAEDGEGSLQPGSGNGPFHKSDLKSKTCLVEAKETSGVVTYSLLKKDLKNLESHAINAHRMPVLMLNFSGDEYVILRRVDWKVIKEQINLNE